ncbi:drug:proton antiporter [Tersicoccus phoenicis]|uniref:Drug:proton antiporter n=1 Tax=Tersicoccus phoenicis TaxID=554083 RepID=A0A1R1LP07_9MICC|nr:geranylgeranyl reductase family protein [Tersicoccus phoenicis]OMH29281.1 drug:proton antiporter [Tersicoccus phoenicis]
MTVVIVGAGPAGSTAAWHLAQAGIETVVLEKTHFPREKVCGDGLTPRAVREIQRIGLPHEVDAGWRRMKGLRLIAAGRTVEVPWPELTDFPDYGLVRTRLGFDEALARHAEAVGATVLTGHNVLGAERDDAGRVTGVRAAVLDADGRRAGQERVFDADVVLAADGNSARTALSVGLERREDRPLGVAVRTYYTSPRHDDDWMEGWLQLPDAAGRPLPGYGWIFGVGDGTSNVGLGILNSSKQFGKIDYRQVLREWTAAMPAEWGYRPENQVGPIRGAALPMGFNRTPHAVPGMLLLGDAGGMVSPFNGEGVSYAMESARFAAECVVAALAAPDAHRRDAALAAYPDVVRGQWGSHFQLGGLFARLIGHPQVMNAALRTGMSAPPLLRLVVRMLANLTDHPGGVEDRAIHLLERLTPPASNQPAGHGPARRRPAPLPRKARVEA